MCTRMSMDIRVHINLSAIYEISSKTLSTSSLTINAPLIVKDEVDKDFSNLSLFTTKQKSYVGLRLIIYLGPACPGALEGPGRAGP